MKEVLFVILNNYSDWEAAPLAAAINLKEGYCVKTVSLTKEPVISIDGFSVNPDYDISEAVERDFAGLIFIGGTSWRTEEARQVLSLLRLAIDNDTVVAAIVMRLFTLVQQRF